MSTYMQAFKDWEIIAAFGYQQYLERGRGAIWLMGKDEIVMRYYIPVKRTSSWPVLEKMVNEYDPENELCLLFEYADKDSDVKIFTDYELPPREAWKQFKGV